MSDDPLRRTIERDFDDPAWSATREVLGRLSDDLLGRIYRGKVAHLTRGVTDAALLLLWPLSWVSAEHRDQFQPATLLDLPMTLAMVDEPVVVAR